MNIITVSKEKAAVNQPRKSEPGNKEKEINSIYVSKREFIGYNDKSSVSKEGERKSKSVSKTDKLREKRNLQYHM